MSSQQNPFIGGWNSRLFPTGISPGAGAWKDDCVGDEKIEIREINGNFEAKYPKDPDGIFRPAIVNGDSITFDVKCEDGVHMRTYSGKIIILDQQTELCAIILGTYHDHLPGQSSPQQDDGGWTGSRP